MCPACRNGEDTHALPVGLGFFDRMLGLSISSRQSNEEAAAARQPPVSQPAASPTWQQPLPRQPEYGGLAPYSSAATSESLEALAAKGWAGMPQSEENKEGAAPPAVGGGGAAAAAAAAAAERRVPSSSQGRRSGSGSLGSLAAMMPWIRGGRGNSGQAATNKASSSQARGGSGFLSGFGRRSQSGNSGSRAASAHSGLVSTDSTLLQGSLAETPRFTHPLYHLVESNRLEPKEPGAPVTARDLNTVRVLSFSAGWLVRGCDVMALSVCAQPTMADPFPSWNTHTHAQVMEATASYVAECMRFYYQVQEIAVPDKAARARCAIMASENWQTASQLMVLVPNHLNGCPLGLWSRSLCIDQGLRFGTMLPYVDTAYREGFAVIICNPAATTAPYTDEKGVVQKVRATTTTRPLLLFHMAISLCCASQTTHPQPHRPPPPTRCPSRARRRPRSTWRGCTTTC